MYRRRSRHVEVNGYKGCDVEAVSHSIDSVMVCEGIRDLG